MDSCLERLQLKLISCTLKFVVDASRLAYWLGKPQHAAWKSEKMAPSKLTHCKYFPYSWVFLYTCFCAVLKHFHEVNSRLGIHSLSAFSTCWQHWRLTSLFCMDTRMCTETTSFSTFSRQDTSMHVILLYFHDLDLWKSLNIVLWKVCANNLMHTRFNALSSNQILNTWLAEGHVISNKIWEWG